MSEIGKLIPRGSIENVSVPPECFSGMLAPITLEDNGSIKTKDENGNISTIGGQTLQIEKNLRPPDLNNISSVFPELIPAQGPNKFVQIVRMSAYLEFNSIPYVGAGNIRVRGAVSGTEYGVIEPVFIISPSTSQGNVVINYNTTSVEFAFNEAVNLRGTTDFLAGDSILKLKADYIIQDFS